tara:strand:+ start:1424 stop:3013 length:1590 start_codon:yes stop_codon:yes gene_type:complete
MAYELTKKQIIKEIVRSGKDPNYFINSFASIAHPIRGSIPFKTFDYQTDLLEDFQDYRFNIVLKARQIGISEICAAYVAWMMLFHKEKNILVLATKLATATNLVKKVKRIIKNLPDWVRISSIIVDNRTSFELSNGSQIKASSTSIDAGRSEALSLLVIDEAAHVESLEELWTALYPTLSTGGRCIALSTPKGVGNWFHKTYVDAVQQLNDFHAVKLTWDVHPERDIEWFGKETKNMSRRQIAQELECEFNTSGETVIHPNDLKYIEENLYEPKYKTGFDRNLWIWEEYKQECSYLLTADVARGDGKDCSTFQIYKLETMEQVAEYQGRITPDLFSNLIFTTGKEYGNCMVAVENAGVGYEVLNKLIDTGYPDVYHSIKSTHEYIDQIAAETINSAVPGFTTSKNTRPLIIAKLEEYVRNKLFNIRSTRLFNELKTFVWYNGRPQAMRSYNDDLVMAAAAGCWIKDVALNINQRDIAYRRAFLEFGGMMRSGITLDTTIPGQIAYDPDKDNENIRKIKKQHEHAWLYKG